MTVTLKQSGHALWPGGIGTNDREALRRTVFREGEAGTRCRLDVPIVAQVARSIGSRLTEAQVLGLNAVAIQAIAFDKSQQANWKVPWHQDLMFPFAKRVSAAGFLLPSVKAGINYACPPVNVLEHMLAVRLHLDDCAEQNGPLRVAPGTHRCGIISSSEVRTHVCRKEEFVCTAKEGETLLMRPLLLHASSKATAPVHRRVLHLVYYSGPPMLEDWYRALPCK